MGGREPREHLMLQYGIGSFSDASEFLAKLAIRLGKLRKGGVPDRETAERMDLQNLPLVRPSEMVNVEAGQINDKAAEVEEEEEMEAENDENALPANIEVFAKQGKRQERKIDVKEKEDPLFKLEGNQRTAKMAKLMEKKRRKERRRGERVAETLSNQMEDAFSKI